MFSSQLQVEGKGKKWRCIVASRCHVLLHGTDIFLSLLHLCLLLKAFSLTMGCSLMQELHVLLTVGQFVHLREADVDVDVLEFIEWSEHLYLYVAFSIKTAQSRVALSFYSSGCITLYALCVCGYLPSMHSTLIFSYIKYICMFLYIYLAAAAHTFHETHWC